jgi:hypothetical protein
MSAALSEIRQLQLDFWTDSSKALEPSSFPSRKPAAKSWNYLPLGTSRARIVVGIDIAKHRVGCKLAILHSAGGLPRDRAELIYEGLRRDQTEIELELGFSNLIWGKPTGTRIYRYKDIPSVDQRSSWPTAVDWLISCAELFKQVFGPRVGQMKVPGAPGTANAFSAVGGWALGRAGCRSRNPRSQRLASRGSTWREQDATAL